MGKAVISDVEGLPCFAVPKNSETRDGIPLFTLVVSNRTSLDRHDTPERVWIFRVEPMGKSTIIRPENCIRYGAVPKLAKQELLVPLQPSQIYTVALQAVPTGSNLRGYKADFCMIPSANNRLRVQVVPWDEKAERWRYEVCPTGTKVFSR